MEQVERVTSIYAYCYYAVWLKSMNNTTLNDLARRIRRLRDGVLQFGKVSILKRISRSTCQLTVVLGSREDVQELYSIVIVRVV